MLFSFFLPLREHGREGEFYSFDIERKVILFGGSRFYSVSPRVTSDLLSIFGSLGFSFITGCAKGVDESFRKAFLESSHKDRTLVACAGKKKADTFKGIHALYVIPSHIPPNKALAQRTLWMVNRASMTILFPSSPMGKGSSLAFYSSVNKGKPVFIVDCKPDDSPDYRIYPSSLFGIVSGFWCIPQTMPSPRLPIGVL